MYSVAPFLRYTVSIVAFTKDGNGPSTTEAFYTLEGGECLEWLLSTALASRQFASAHTCTSSVSARQPAIQPLHAAIPAKHAELTCAYVVPCTHTHARTHAHTHTQHSGRIYGSITLSSHTQCVTIASHLKWVKNTVTTPPLQCRVVLSLMSELNLCPKD